MQMNVVLGNEFNVTYAVYSIRAYISLLKYFAYKYICTSTILVPIGDQDPTVHLTQMFLEGRGSTNFGSQSDLSTPSKALRAVD